MWKQSLSFWEAVSLCANVITVLAGGIVATSALFSQVIIGVLAGLIVAISGFISWYASKKASGIVQREADERIAVAEQRATEANEKAERERLARAPMSLSRTQDLIDKLRPFAGTPIIVRGVFGSGLDIVPLTNQIVSVLEAAEWKLTILDVQLMGTREYVEGIMVMHSEGSDDKTIAAADLWKEAFKANGIVSKRFVSLDDPPNMIRMVIGSKP